MSAGVRQGGGLACADVWQGCGLVCADVWRLREFFVLPLCCFLHLTGTVRRCPTFF